MVSLRNAFLLALGASVALAHPTAVTPQGGYHDEKHNQVPCLTTVSKDGALAQACSVRQYGLINASLADCLLAKLNLLNLFAPVSWVSPIRGGDRCPAKTAPLCSSVQQGLVNIMGADCAKLDVDALNALVGPLGGL